jgi:hypothetical protein
MYVDTLCDVVELPPIDEPSYLPGCERRDRRGNTCGQPVKYATGRFCEDCDVRVNARYDGRDQSVNTLREHND